MFFTPKEQFFRGECYVRFFGLFFFLHYADLILCRSHELFACLDGALREVLVVRCVGVKLSFKAERKLLSESNAVLAYILF